MRTFCNMYDLVVKKTCMDRNSRHRGMEIRLPQAFSILLSIKEKILKNGNFALYLGKNRKILT